MWTLEYGEVLANEQIAPGYFRMKIHLPEISAKAHPGQFIMWRVDYHLSSPKNNQFSDLAADFHGQELLLENTTDPLLPRPICISDVKKSKGEVSILYQVVGKGTKKLASVQKGDEIAVFGPLGTGFSIDEGQEVALLAGGIGIAPLHYLISKLMERGNKIHLLAGFATESQVALLDELQDLDISVHVSTEDGSKGHCGRVTELLEEFLKNQLNKKDINIDKIYTCGPEPMMAQVISTAEQHQISSQLSLERKMACGVGACKSCTCDTNGNGNSFNSSYLHVCTDGPVFNGGEVVLQNE